MPGNTGGARVALLCLPFAGAGPSFYLPWRRLDVAGLEVRPVPLPGRERLIDEAPYTDLHRAADALLPVALDLAGEQPVALFGHCFLGAVLAYELTHRLVDRGRAVEHLFVSAARAPWNGRPWSAAGLGDEDFVALVQEATRYRHPALDIPEIREHLLPMLRADFAMDETYRHRDRAPLATPITAIVASDDDLVSAADAAHWQAATTAGFDLVELPGGHMYLADAPERLVELIAGALRGPAERVGSA